MQYYCEKKMGHEEQEEEVLCWTVNSTCTFLQEPYKVQYADTFFAQKGVGGADERED